MLPRTLLQYCFAISLATTSLLGATCPTGYTTVTGTLTNPANVGKAVVFTGAVDITPPATPLVSGGTAFGPNHIVIPNVSGTFSVCLIPNDTANPPGTTYRASFSGNDGTRWSETWVVPTSATAVTLASVRQITPVVPVPPVLTTKGDFLTFGRVPQRFPVGANGTVPTADSTQPTGWAWKFGAGQVNSDWNAGSGVAQILNKPTLGTASTHDTEYFQAPIIGAPGTWPTFAAVATSGSYTDLSGKPTIPDAQVNADWNASVGVAQILNKPTLGTASGHDVGYFQTAISGAPSTWPTLGTAASHDVGYFQTAITGAPGTWPALGTASTHDVGYFQTAISGAPGTWPSLATVATSGSYTDLSSKPTIPAAQVNSDWAAGSGVAQILNKPTLGTASTHDATDFAPLVSPSFTTPALGTIASGNGAALTGVVHLIASGTASLGTTTVNTGTCSGAIDGGTATGVLTTDTIQTTVNADPVAVTGYTPATTGTLYVWAYPTADHINFKLCNNTAGNITPGSAITLNWKVTR